MGADTRHEVAAVKDETWKAAAACLAAAPDLFFTQRGERLDDAKQVCAACPVQAECLTYALTAPPELWGVWGGTSERERKRLRHRRRVSA